MARRETDALTVALGGDWSATLTNLRRDRSGALAPTIWLECDGDGAVRLTAPLAIESAEGRDEWAARAATAIGDPAITATTIAQAIESAIPDLIRALQDEAGRPSQADRLVDLAADADLFHTPEGDTYATIAVDGHRETHGLRAKGFRRWLAGQFYRQHGKAPGAQALQDALGVLEGRAVFGGREEPVAVRLAAHGGDINLDLGDPDWRAVAIDATGWRVAADPPVRFRRPKGLLALPAPVPGGAIDSLRPFLNVDSASDDDFALIVAWLVAALRPTGPYPVLALSGEQGSAKSTTARVLRSLIDPNAAALRAQPGDEKDLIIAATNGAILVLDNLSALPGWLSDALCRLATGGGFATRELYSDADETLFSAQRPIILNGIPDLVARGDLLSRSIVVALPPIPDAARQTEGDFWSAFEAARPAILGALLDAVAHGLAHLLTTRLARLPRMADFARWSCAALPGVGIAADDFMRAYAANIAAANELALDTSPLVAPLRGLVAKDGAVWVGTATELLMKLEGAVGEATTRRRDWPKNARALSAALRRIAPNLRAEGIAIEAGERREGGRHSKAITVRDGQENNRGDLRGLRGQATEDGDSPRRIAESAVHANGHANRPVHANAGISDDLRGHLRGPDLSSAGEENDLFVGGDHANHASSPNYSNPRMVTP